MGVEIRLHAVRPELRGVLGAVADWDEVGAPSFGPEPAQADVVLIVARTPLRCAWAPDAPLRSFDALISTPQAAPAWVGHDGRSAGVQLGLHPFAARRLLGGIPLDRLAGEMLALDDVLGREARELHERLGGASCAAERFAIVERWAARRLASHGGYGDPVVARAERALAASAGRTPIAPLVADSGLSHRHFGARFRAAIGVSPKRYARLLRFRRALALLRGGEPPAGVAALAGYADQAHLTRECRALAGRTPGRLGVDFVQDRGAAAA